MSGKELTQLHNDPRTPAREGKELSEVQQTICERIMLGESVLAICKDEDMPSRRTVMNWIAKDLDFRAAYLAAKALLAETFSEEIIEIANDGALDWIEGENGKELDREHVQRSKLKIDARKWVAARLAPKRWGDASMIRVGELDGPSGRENSDMEMFTRLAAIAAKATKGSE